MGDSQLNQHRPKHESIKMVEADKSLFDDASDDSPPLVAAAHVIPDLETLEPIGVHVVTIDGDAIPCQASVVSYDSAEVMMSYDEAPVDGRSQAWSAGIAGGVLGTLVGGPLLGAVAGATAAYYSGKDGAAGDTARAMGDVARTTGKKAREVNEKHKFVDKSKQAAETAWFKMKRLDKKHNFAKKSQNAVSAAWANARKFNKKHGVVDKLRSFAVLCLKRFSKIVEEISGRLLENTPHQQQPATRIPQKPVTCY